MEHFSILCIFKAVILLYIPLDRFQNFERLQEPLIKKGLKVWRRQKFSAFLNQKTLRFHIKYGREYKKSATYEHFMHFHQI